MVPANPARKARIAHVSAEAAGAPGKARKVLQRTLDQLRPEPALATGVLYREDNLKQLAMMPADCIDLVYLDPPFFSNRSYEVIWGDEAEVRSFEDRWSGGMEVYIGWMRDRLMEVRRILKPTGSVYLHCDAHASHYLKVMMDVVFGMQNFRNEIIWRRTGSNSAAKRFGPIHQTILYYVKSNAAPFYPMPMPYTEGYVRDYFTESDQRGRYRPVLLTGPGTRNGDSGSQWRHHNPTAGGRHWQPATYVYDKYRDLTGDDLSQWPLLERLDRLDAIGLIHWNKDGGGVPNYKYYLADAPGVLTQDIWAFTPGTEGAVYKRPKDGIDQDVKWLGPKDRERLGYPTQKPEGVLARIINCSSRVDDVVLDPFCGCGTTIAVAEKLKRRWIGIDISPTACNLMVRRLAKIGAVDIQVHGMPTTLDELRLLKPFEFQNWVIDRLNGQQANRRSGDMGIDGWTFFLHDPVQIKQSERVGREVVDKFETAIERAGKKSGAIVAFSFGRGAHEESARVRKNGVLIHLLRVTDLLERLDWAMTQLGIAGGKPDLKVAPLPQFDAARHTSEELIASAHRGA